MNKLTAEEKTDMLGYFWACVICACLLLIFATVYEVTANQPEPYEPPCRTVGHMEVPCE